MFTNDIYVSIGNSLLKDGFHNINDVPANVIEEKIKEYLKQKLYIKAPDISITMLMQELEKTYLLDADKEKSMANICFYLLWYMSMLQQFEIVWKIEEGLTYLKESEYYPGKISELITPKNIDYVATTCFLLEEATKLNERINGRK